MKYLEISSSVTLTIPPIPWLPPASLPTITIPKIPAEGVPVGSLNGAAVSLMFALPVVGVDKVTDSLDVSPPAPPAFKSASLSIPPVTDPQVHPLARVSLVLVKFSFEVKLIVVVSLESSKLSPIVIPDKVGLTPSAAVPNVIPPLFVICEDVGFNSLPARSVIVLTNLTFGLALGPRSAAKSK